jgi:hypothetical protein
MEIIDIGLSDLEPINISLDDIGGYGSSSSSSSSNVNFGPGIELLMNEKKKSANNSTSIDLGELDKLENELNELSNQNNSGTKSLSGLSGFGGFTGFSDIFGSSSSSDSKRQSEDNSNTDSNLGQATSDSMGNTKTWDGFSKIGEVPQQSSGKSLSDREKRRKKRAMIQKLQEWYEKGQIKNNSHFTVDSNYEEIEDEYENLKELMKNIKRIYEKHAKIPKKDLSDVLKHDLWWNPEKCMSYGLVDELWEKL